VTTFSRKVELVKHNLYFIPVVPYIQQHHLALGTVHVVEGYVHSDKGTSAQVQLEMEAIVTGDCCLQLRCLMIMIKDFSAEVLREAKFLGLDESAFLASVFDVPKVITEGKPPLTNAVSPVVKSGVFIMTPKNNIDSKAMDDTGHHHEVPVTQESQSNVITILDSQSQGLGQLSDDILLHYPYAGGEAVEEACSCLEFYSSK